MTNESPSARLGLTLKLILEVGGEEAQQFRQLPPGQLRVAGEAICVESLRVTAGPVTATPVRLSVRVEELDARHVEDFLAE